MSFTKMMEIIIGLSSGANKAKENGSQTYAPVEEDHHATRWM